MNESWLIYAKIRQHELDRELGAIYRKRELKRAMKQQKIEQRNRRPRYHSWLCALGARMTALGHGLMDRYGCRERQWPIADPQKLSGVSAR